MPSAAVTERAKTVTRPPGAAGDTGGGLAQRLHGTLRRGLELTALVGFAITQPAFSVISKTPEFFALRGSSRTEIVAFALAMSVGIPAALLLVELVAGLVTRWLARGLHLSLVALLSALFAVPLVQGAVDHLAAGDRTPSGWLVLAAALVVGVAAALAYARSPLVRSYLLVLSPAPLVFMGFFLAQAPSGRLALPPAGPVTKPAPVVMLVFDEFPVASLMDARQRIDARRYPNFAALARGSTWYRRTTTVSDITTSAVPAILTGSLPPPGTPPTTSELPRNIFALLRESHRLRVTESFTRMCPAGTCDGAGLSALPRRTLATVADAVEIAAHAAAPPDLEPRLGRLGEGVELGDAAAPLQRFIARLHRTDRPELDFIHVLLPHYPWVRLPSGRSYERAPPLELPRGFQAGAVQRWDPDPWLVREEWHRHLLQVGYLDRMLGKVLRRLRAVGMYDRTLIVAVADHGVSFHPGEQMRDVTPRNVQDIAFVPLFIKAPGQHHAAVIDRPARTIDVLPTVMQILGGRIPWKIQGRSLVGDHRAARPAVTVTSSRLPPVTTSAALLERRFRAALRRRIRAFGTRSALVDADRHPEWIGRRLGEPGVRLGKRTTVRLDRRGELMRVSRASGFVPVLVTGEVRARLRARRELVLVVNHRVGAVVPVKPWWAGPPTFSAIVPERLVRDGANSIAAFWTA